MENDVTIRPHINGGNAKRMRVIHGYRNGKEGGN